MQLTKPLIFAPFLALLTTFPALACTPGGFFCFPSEADVLADLRDYNRSIEVVSVKFSTEPFGRPEDKFQRFRVYYEAVGMLKADSLEKAYGEELQKACGLPVDQYPSPAKPIFIRQASKGDEVLITGDIAMVGNDAGEWESGAHLTIVKTMDGVDINGFERADQAELAIIGEPSGDAACTALKG